MKTTLTIWGLFLVLLFSGCDSGGGTPMMQDVKVPQEPETSKAEPEAEPVLIEAKPGVTGKGQYSASPDYNPASIYTVPIATYFKTQELSVFNISIPEALKLFQASAGYYPRSQEEFDQEIIKANKIVLPKLQDGDRYVYDPETAKLMVLTTRVPNR